MLRCRRSRSGDASRRCRDTNLFVTALRCGAAGNRRRRLGSDATDETLLARSPRPVAVYDAKCGARPGARSIRICYCNQHGMAPRAFRLVCEREERYGAMAILFENDDGSTREGWLRYAVEFARRGLYPPDEITTHGPHAEPADRIWGAAEARDHRRTPWIVSFETAPGIVGRDDLDTLTMWSDDDDERRAFPVLARAELKPEVRTLLRRTRRELARLRQRPR